jgi:hypothetical protein
MLEPVISHQTVRLSKGKHGAPHEGVCVMELASMLGHEPFTDRPRSACRVIAAFLRGYNDAVDDPTRQTLYAYAAAVVGTANGAARTRRLDRLLAELGSMRRPLLRRRQQLTMPASDDEVERLAADVARALWRARGRGGHERALQLIDEMLAISPADGAVTGSVTQRNWSERGPFRRQAAVGAQTRSR